MGTAAAEAPKTSSIDTPSTELKRESPPGESKNRRKGRPRKIGSAPSSSATMPPSVIDVKVAQASSEVVQDGCEGRTDHDSGKVAQPSTKLEAGDTQKKPVRDNLQETPG